MSYLMPSPVLVAASVVFAPIRIVCEMIGGVFGIGEEERKKREAKNFDSSKFHDELANNLKRDERILIEIMESVWANSFYPVALPAITRNNSKGIRVTRIDVEGTLFSEEKVWMNKNVPYNNDFTVKKFVGFIATRKLKQPDFMVELDSTEGENKRSIVITLLQDNELVEPSF
jgi:hypothetical protein